MFLLLLRFVSLLFASALASLAATENELDRELVLTALPGATREDAAIREAQLRAGRSEATAPDFERLGWAFVAKARRTLDGAYYTLAEKTVAVCDASLGATPELRLLLGHVWENQHRFHEVEVLARSLTAERVSPEAWALLSDALMEQGMLAESVDALQRMVNLKPGSEASSRIAHLRWLKGDLPGAVAAMQDAARAVASREQEAAAWTLARLAGYYLQQGRSDASGRAAEAAVVHAPDYPPALLALGRAQLAENQTARAVVTLQRAASLNPLPEYQWWLADALRLEGRTADALVVEQKLVERGAASDPRTLAWYLASRRESASTAIRLAREELEVRADVFTHDALAWALAANGDVVEARVESRAALAEHTADARILLHAGEIALAAGQNDEAARFFAQARPLAAALTPSECARLERHANTAPASSAPVAMGR